MNFLSPMSKHRSLRIVWVFLLSWLAVSVHAQTSDESLFAGVRAAFAQAKQDQTDAYAPRTYAKAAELLQKAEQDFAKGRKRDSVQKTLAESEQTLIAAQNFAATARKELNTVIKTRADALAADTPKFAAEAWRKGDERFTEAVSRIERNEVEGARRKGAEAEVLLRDAELLAIKADILGEARSLIAQADEKEVGEFAPRSLDAAKRFLAQADAELTRSRYETNEPRRLTAQAAYEARHAMYLATQIARLQEGDSRKQHELEQTLLAVEEPIKKLAAEVNIEVRFDQGYAGPMQQLLTQVQKRGQQLSSLQQDVADRDDQIVLLNTEIQKVQDKLGGESAERQSLLRRLSAQERQRENIAAIEGLFTADEGRVYRQGNNIVMSLTGINFRSGKSTIEPSSFAVLEKVNQALKLFPEASTTVEGHTDAEGSDSANLLLSQDRADAVRQYMVSNMVINPEKLSSVGYGESRPVASNETEQGRAKNRRIDLVIHIQAN